MTLIPFNKFIFYIYLRYTALLKFLCAVFAARFANGNSARAAVFFGRFPKNSHFSVNISQI